MNIKTTLVACSLAAACMLSVGNMASAQDAGGSLTVTYMTCSTGFVDCTPVAGLSTAVTNLDAGVSYTGRTDGAGVVSYAVGAGTYEIQEVPGDAIDDSWISCRRSTGGPEDSPVDYPAPVGDGQDVSCDYYIVPANAQGPTPAPSDPSTSVPSQLPTLPKTGAGTSEHNGQATDLIALLGSTTMALGVAGTAFRRRAARR